MRFCPSFRFPPFRAESPPAVSKKKSRRQGPYMGWFPGRIRCRRFCSVVMRRRAAQKGAGACRPHGLHHAAVRERTNARLCRFHALCSFPPAPFFQKRWQGRRFRLEKDALAFCLFYDLQIRRYPVSSLRQRPFQSPRCSRRQHSCLLFRSAWPRRRYGDTDRS